jgi:hypothetical protein
MAIARGPLRGPRRRFASGSTGPRGSAPVFFDRCAVPSDWVLSNRRAISSPRTNHLRPLLRALSNRPWRIHWRIVAGCKPTTLAISVTESSCEEFAKLAAALR